MMSDVHHNHMDEEKKQKVIIRKYDQDVIYRTGSTSVTSAIRYITGEYGESSNEHTVSSRQRSVHAYCRRCNHVLLSIIIRLSHLYDSAIFPANLFLRSRSYSATSGSSDAHLYIAFESSPNR